MMNPHTVQNIMGTAYVQKLDQAARSEIPFADYDVLTPDEPGWAWQLAKQLLQVSNHLVHEFFKNIQPFRKPILQAVSIPETLK